MADEFPPPGPPHPAPMADGGEPPPPWADLPIHIVRGIASRLLCKIDRRFGEGVCRSWREAFLQVGPPPPPLPLLVVANAGEHAFHCVPSNWRTHPIPIPMPRFAHHRYFGSYDGGWLFLSISQSSRHGLHNINKNVNSKRFRFSLPDQRLYQIRPTTAEADKFIVIVAATLSCQPTEPGCVAAGIIDLHSFPDHPSGHGAGAFLFLTNGEHIREFPQPIFPPPGTAKRVRNELYFKPRGDDGGGGRPVLARYLVESRDELLMVVRLGTLEHSWIKLADLGGRMLFVGRGCSRSYEAADGYPGMEGVYFLDDRSFYDRTTVFKNDDKRKYHRSDIGKWSGSPPQVRHCLPEQVLNHVHNEADRVADREFDGIALNIEVLGSNAKLTKSSMNINGMHGASYVDFTNL
uniref:KIB1-4 beta-propeller domain-containing protein n=1 Tax=Oryza glaberrima TaxID=4538 RepID=I1R5Y2_ORYGL